MKGNIKIYTRDNIVLENARKLGYTISKKKIKSNIYEN
jgi:hypothetical protein